MRNTDIKKTEWLDPKTIEWVDMTSGKTEGERETICVLGNYGKFADVHGNGKPWYVSTMHDRIRPERQGIWQFDYFEHAEVFAIECVLDIFG